MKNNIKTALTSMRSEVEANKKYAEDFLADVDEMEPEELSFNDMDVDGESVPLEDEFAGDLEDGELGEEKIVIETVEDAKKYLNEAKDDLTAVIDNLDGILGQTEEEIDKLAYKRSTAAYQSNLTTLSNQADKSIVEAKASVKHWSFLKKAHNPAATITDSKLAEAAQTVLEVSKFSKLMTKIFQKEATAVPPTGAEFSGDKFPGGKDPKEVEDRAWHGSAEKFNRDTAFENARANPAVDHRLDTTEYSRDEKPYINASLHKDANKFASAWDIFDSKNQKRMIVSFANVPDSIGARNDNTFKIFANKNYGEEIIKSVAKNGIEVTRKALNGVYASVANAGMVSLASLEAISKEPKLKDKTLVRKYYTDMYGDAEYARALTSKKTNTASAPKSKTAADMNVAYTPKDEHPKDKKTENVKDGTGKLSNQDQDPQEIKAKARKSVEIARKFAAVGSIPFTKTAIYNKSRELVQGTVADMNVVDVTLSQLPIVNEAALVEAHIPETESGIVGSTRTGVSDPKSTVNTENLDSKVNGDAKFSSVVPQSPNAGVSGMQIANSFTTIANKLERKGINPASVLKKPHYRQS